MSEEKSADGQPAAVNPFYPPEVFEVPQAQGLGKGYWFPLFGFLGFAVLVAAALDLWVGLFGIATSVFAIYHGFVYQSRLVQRTISGEEVRQISDLGLCACSLFLGVAGCTAGGIAFVVTCFPAGLLVFDINPITGRSSAQSEILLPLICVACAIIALVFVGWFLSWFTPRKPSR